MASESGIETSQALIVGIDRWLRLRWWLVPLQILAITAAGPEPFQASVLGLGVIAALELSLGLLAARWRLKKDATLLLGGLLLGDIVLLSLALALCGGPSNPFSVLYLVYVTLACVLLGPAYGWTSLAVAAGLYATLFWLSPQACCQLSQPGGPATPLHQHLWSMYFAFIAVAALVVTFVASVMRTLRKREAALADVKARADRNERLANIMVLAAGTAHEMATPLATIAVTAKELERAASGLKQSQWVDDARLIRNQVDRCRRLLDELRGHAGAVEGERPMHVRLDEAVAAVAASFTDDMRRRVAVAPAARSIDLFLPRTAFVQVLGNLVRNALEASGPGDPVTVDATARADSITVTVRDRGQGMDLATLGRAREPFFTTKPAGAGLGLGLFLADRFACEVGGSLALDSRPGYGTEVRLEVPA